MKICSLTLTFVLISFSAIAGECDFIKFNECRSCDEPLYFTVGSDKACSFLCPNREINYEGSGSQAISRNCALKKCPKDLPFQSEYGNCYATQEEAEEDYGRHKKENFNEDDMQEGGYSSAPLAIDGKCPKDFPLLYSKKCFSCEEIEDLHISEEECKKCPNRIYKFYPNWGFGFCELPVPKDKPICRWDGKCFPCDEPKPIQVKTHCNLERECDVCPNRTILYWLGGNVPSIPNCPKDKPLMDSEGICYACDVPIPVGLEDNTRLCERFCPNERHVSGIYCVLNKK